MVVHTPTKLEVLRQTAAERRAASEGEVPPSVAAAAAAAAADAGAPTTEDQAALQADLLDDRMDRPADDPLSLEFAAWNGVAPPGSQIETQAEIETERGQGINSNVTTRKKLADTAAGGQARSAAQAADDDKISVVSDVTPPPPPPPAAPSGLNPFTPEWFAQMIGAAASAAATAAAKAVVNAPNPTPAPPATPASAPRRLNERKIPDFWEDKPDFWFRIFDAHLAHFSPSEMKCFDALLPLLTPAARTMVHSIIRTPGRTPYSKARQVLLRHFGRTPHQLAREFRETRSLGDRLPSEWMEHLQSLLPDISALYEVKLLDALPNNARDAALQQTGLSAMLAAADQVVLGNRALAASEAAVNALSLEDASPAQHVDAEPMVAAARRVQPPAAPARAAPRKNGDLCPIHARYGKEAYKCLRPSYCRMRDVVRPMPSSAAPASGNGKAGGQ